MDNIKTFVVADREVLFYKECDHSDDAPYIIVMKCYFNGLTGGISPSYVTQELRDEAFNLIDQVEATRLVNIVLTLVKK